MKTQTKTIYGIHKNEDMVFLSQEAAEEYLFKNYKDCFTGKESFYEFCENMIWESNFSNLKESNYYE